MCVSASPKLARCAQSFKSIRLIQLNRTAQQIASLLSSPSSTLSPSSLVPTLKAQHASLVSLASAVSALDLELKQLKDEYRAIYREKTGRTSDPFRVNGSGAAVGAGSGLEKSVGGLALR